MNHTSIQKLFPPNLAYRNFVFIPLFFTFYIVLKIFGSSDFLLENFTNRSISFATSEAIDIGKRVATFYKAIGFASILLILFTRLAVIVRSFVNDEELKIANGLSLAGFCLLFFQLLGADMSDTIHLIFSLLIVVTSGFVYHQIKKRDEREFLTVFTWTAVISVSIFFLQWQIFSFAIGKTLFSLPKIVTITGVPIYLLFTNRFHFNYRIFNASRPLIFIPILSFLSVELFMILNQRGIFLSPKTIYAIGITIIAFRIFILSKKSIVGHTLVPMLQIIFKRWFPWMIAGISLVSFYNPIVKPTIDWFEDANKILPLQQWFTFGKVPFLESFNSHTLSDFGTGILYSLLNGADPLGVYVYGFFTGIVVILLVYFLTYKITGDGFLSLWIAIAYPYTDLLIPTYYNFVPLAALAFVSLYEKQTTSRYIFFFGTILFMPIWRIDLGLSTITAGIAGFIFLIFFVPSFSTDWKKLRNGFAITISIILILAFAAFIHSGSHLLVAVKDALGYLSSFQSYGLKELSYAHDIKYFSLYFIFPAVILLILIYSIFNVIREHYADKKSIVFSLALIFFGFFYLSNLQRGLVRHTLAEGWDTAFTSYGFFIISSIILIRYVNKNAFIRFFLFFIVSTILVLNYVFKVPDLTLNNYYSYLSKRLNNQTELIFSKEKINRIILDPSSVLNYNEFSDWMRSNIPDTASYIDFSNTPMLYYFTNRILPNYLPQIPHTAHSEYLQNRFIEDLKNYDLPIAVVSNVPQSFWDNLDGIPNTIRHYRISEYIYRNYTPAYILSHHSVWIKKGMPLAKEHEIYSVQRDEMSLTGITMTDSVSLFSNSESGTLNYVLNNPVRYHGKKIYVKLEINSGAYRELTIQYKSSSGNFNDRQKTTFKLNQGNNNLFLPVALLENENDLSAIRITLPGNLRTNLPMIRIFSSEYLPDYLSRQPADYSLKWIPYIWGSYDNNSNVSGITSEANVFSGSKNLEANKEYRFTFAPVKDKESGNYVRIIARVLSGKQTDLVLGYGIGMEKSGSFSFTLKNDNKFHEYLIRISSQYGWYSKNNMWLSIYPIANDVELKETEILKGD